MISRETLNAIYPIVERLSTAGMRLVPLEESPIAELNTAAYAPIVDTFVGETGFEEAWLETLKRSPVLGLVEPYEVGEVGSNVFNVPSSLHSTSMDELVNYVHMHTNNAMNYARNVAVPIINAVTDQVEASIGVSNTIKEQYEIVEIGMHDAWSHNVVINALEVYKTSEPVLARPLINKLPKPPEGYFTSLANTGYDVLDNLIKSMVKEFGVTIEESFNSTFNGFHHLGEGKHPEYMNRNVVLFDYLVASLVAAKPYEGCGLSSAAWEGLMGKVLRALGGYCQRLATYHKSDVTSKRLLLGVDDGRTHIYVNREVYDMWIDAGGCPELILGARLRDPLSCKHIKYSEMLDEAAVNTAAWNGWRSSEQLRLSAERTNIFKTALFNALVTAIQNFEPLNSPNGEVNVKALINHARELTANIKTYQLDNAGMLCLELTCLLLFSHTPSRSIIGGIEALCNSGMSPEEAAILVECDYIVDWICQGLGLTKQ